MNDEPKRGDTSAADHEASVIAIMANQEAKDDARRRLAAKGRPPIPAGETLDKFLKESDKPPEWRIRGLARKRAHNTLVAQWKAGKTEMRNNVVRSLVDGNKFLGEFEATAISGRVGILDLEMERDQSRQWLREQGIKNTQKVKTWHLKGKLSSFAIIDPDRRSEWAAEIRAAGTEYLILDCLAPALTANGLTESNDDVSVLLMAWDELCEEAGVSAMPCSSA
jgi:RecA-family ATPase